MRLCAAYKVFNGALFLPYSLKSIYDHVDRIVVFLSTAPWNGPLVPPDDTEEIVRGFPDPQGKITLVVRNFRYQDSPEDGYKNELTEMNELLAFIAAETPKNTHYLYIDADEVYHSGHIRALRRILTERPEINAVRCPWRTYWKSFRYWIDPMEPFRPLVAFKIQDGMRFTKIRDVSTEPASFLDEREVMLHHFSYSLTNDMVRAKIRAWSHCNEIRKDWFERVWLAWDWNRQLEDLHPTWPEGFKRAVRADEAALPEVMKGHPFYGKDIV